MTRKQRVSLSPEQKLEYAKMMVENVHSNKQIMEIAGVGVTVVSPLFSLRGFSTFNSCLFFGGGLTTKLG